MTQPASRAEGKFAKSCSPLTGQRPATEWWRTLECRVYGANCRKGEEPTGGQAIEPSYPRWRIDKMVRTLTALTAAGAIALATVSLPTRAEANPAWLIPALIVGGVVVVAASAASANAYYAPGYYAPAGSVYVQPRVASRCHIVRERTPIGWHKVRVCR